MSRAIIKIQHSNPNPGGGCLCSPHSKIVDCKAPYAVFTAAEMMDLRQPHAVACTACLEDFAAKLARQLSGGVAPKRNPAPGVSPEAEAALAAVGTVADRLEELARDFRGL